ncbi:MAG: Rrf2 family transcriptional regulator [Myxococcota bacterium]
MGNSQFALALHILGFLTSQRGRPLTSEQMAATYGTSPVVLRRVLILLRQAGLVETRRGVGGGSTLARDPAEINLREVYEIVNESTEILRRYPSNVSGLAAPVMAEFVNELYAEAERAMLEKLASVTVAEMDREIRARICDTAFSVRKAR